MKRNANMLPQCPPSIAVATGASVAHRFTIGISLQVVSGVNSGSGGGPRLLYGYQPPLRPPFGRMRAKPSSKSETKFTWAGSSGGFGHGVPPAEPAVPPPSPGAGVGLSLLHAAVSAARPPKAKTRNERDIIFMAASPFIQESTARAPGQR